MSALIHGMERLFWRPHFPLPNSAHAHAYCSAGIILAARESSNVADELKALKRSRDDLHQALSTGAEAAVTLSESLPRLPNRFCTPLTAPPPPPSQARAWRKRAGCTRRCAASC